MPKKTIKNIPDLQSALVAAFLAAGADKEVAWDIESTTYALRTSLAKFNQYAYDEGEPSDTTLSLGAVKKTEKGFSVAVMAKTHNLGRQIATVNMQ